MTTVDPAAIEMISSSPDQTAQIGEQLGRLLRGGEVICLNGQLGAGKTVFAQGVGRGWGATDNLTSPTFTLIHEYGHLLTLGPDQVPPSLAVFNNPEDNDIYLKELSACPDYFPGEGCANPDSYINAFYNQFWADIHEEWQQINLEEDPDLLQQGLDDFYAKYQDQFVTDYAATNPEEDMAESWSFFVLGPKPAGDTIAEQKTLFFYNYPELVELRSAILNNLCTSFPQ